MLPAVDSNLFFYKFLIAISILHILGIYSNRFGIINLGTKEVYVRNEMAKHKYGGGVAVLHVFSFLLVKDATNSQPQLYKKEFFRIIVDVFGIDTAVHLP